MLGVKLPGNLKSPKKVKFIKTMIGALEKGFRSS